MEFSANQKEDTQIEFHNFDFTILFDQWENSIFSLIGWNFQGWEKKPGKFEKWEKREKLPFFQNTCLKSILNHWKINDEMFWWPKLSIMCFIWTIFSSKIRQKNQIIKIKLPRIYHFWDFLVVKIGKDHALFTKLVFTTPTLQIFETKTLIFSWCEH